MAHSTVTLPLLETLRDQARDPGLLDLVQRHPTERSWLQLPSNPDLTLWLIAWPPGTSTDWHDHGPASGAFVVLEGTLVEHSWLGALRVCRLGVGDSREFAADHVHDVRNTSARPAVSLHAYSPRLEVMTRYRFLGDRIEAIGVERAGEGW